jgi:hypothetical protein
MTAVTLTIKKVGVMDEKYQEMGSEIPSPDIKLYQRGRRTGRAKMAKECQTLRIGGGIKQEAYMLEKMSESSGPVVGYRVVGKVTAEDYQQLNPEIAALVDKYGSVDVLLDMQEFAGEEVKAWLPDLKFGHRFHDNVAKMAIVGDKRWEKWMTDLIKPFYAKEGEFFPPDEIDKAWAWLRQKKVDGDS